MLMSNKSDRISSGSYAHLLTQTALMTSDIFKSSSAAEQERFKKFKGPFDGRKFSQDIAKEDSLVQGQRAEAFLGLLKAQHAALRKAGVTTATGYNFYDLRAPIFMLAPVNTPLRNSIAKIGRVNAGVGTAAHWKATRNFANGGFYPGVLEGQRNSLSAPDENDYVATYKEIGIERGVSYTAQFSGEGLTDNLADEHLRMILAFSLGDEGLILGGNGGTQTGNNGFVLGTANTPVAALVTTSTGNVPAGSVSCRVVEITALGNPQNQQYGYGAFPTAVAGLTPSYTRTNYDGSTISINTGTGAISAASNVVTADSTHKQATFTVTPKPGAVAWAWFVDLTDASAPSAANATLTAITTVPSLTFNMAAAAGTQAGNAAGLSTDHSFNGGVGGGANEYDGLLSYAAAVGIWTNLYSGTNQGYGNFTAPAASPSGLTALTNGRIKEFELILAAIWQQYQAPVTTIWCSADAKQSASDTIMSTSGNVPTAFHFNYTRDSQGEIIGGFTVDAYKSQFAMDPSGAKAIPIRIHPMLPPGTIYFDVAENPYDTSRLSYLRAFLMQRDTYAIEWPQVTRQYTFGMYEHKVLAHTMPWLTAVITGVTPT